MTEESRILINRAGSGWSAPEASAYRDEGHLQQLLFDDPARIPGVAPEALSARELPTAAGPIDVCVVGRDGSITVIECKLASSSERRRMVIGQVIDYAAAVWMGRDAVFLSAWERASGVDLARELDEGALEALRNNINGARIDLCLAVDAIDEDLRRLIEFLNRVTLPEVRVTAVQLAYARDGDVEILIPSTFGGEIAEAKARVSGRRENWTTESFLAALGSEEDRVIARDIFDRTERLERRGPDPMLWHGHSPRGGINLHLYGLKYPPVWLSINGDRSLMVGGTWNAFAKIAHHDAYAPLAALMGLDHRVGSKSVRLSDLDLDDLWATIVECALGINVASDDADELTVGSTPGTGPG